LRTEGLSKGDLRYAICRIVLFDNCISLTNINRTNDDE
jgi:hypothetical protein